MDAEPNADLRMIEEAVGRIVEMIQPRRIILFGSAARGQMGPNSDVDLLVVVRDGTHRRRTAQLLYRSLMAAGFAKDIVVVTESDLLKFGDDPTLVIHEAIRGGRELYGAA